MSPEYGLVSREDYKLEGRGVAPPHVTLLYNLGTRNEYMSPDYRVSRKRCPNSLPANGGFPPFHCTLQRRKKLASLKHFSSNSCKAPFLSGHVIREIAGQIQCQNTSNLNHSPSKPVGAHCMRPCTSEMRNYSVPALHNKYRPT